MSSVCFVLLLAACGRSPAACVGGGADRGSPAPNSAPEPVPKSWPDAWTWNWAAVLRVDAALTAPLAAGDLTLDLSMEIIRDSLLNRPVSLWLAPPGATLSVPGAAPGIEGQPQVFTVPTDAADGSYLVATDRGLHVLSWGPDMRVRELQLALGLEPWRAIIAVGGDQDLRALRSDRIQQQRLREHGIVLVSLANAQPVGLPFSDLPLESLDVEPVMAGQAAGQVLAAHGEPPRLVTADRPVALLRAASLYFGLELIPRAGRVGGHGLRDRDRAREGDRPPGKARTRRERRE